MNNKPRYRTRISSSLSCYRVLLARQRFPEIDVALLEDGSSVTEDEVDGSIDVTFAIKLTLLEEAEGILVAFEATSEESREI